MWININRFLCDDNIVVTQGCENLAKREACNRPVS